MTFLRRCSDGTFTEVTLQVIPAKRSHWFSFAAIFGSKRDNHMLGIEILLRHYCDHWARTGAERARRYREAEELLQSITSFDTRTLEVIEAYFTAGNNFNGMLPMLVTYRSYPESIIREALTYMDCMQNLMIEERKNAFHDVRNSHARFAREDLSELQGDERLAAESVLRVSVAMMRNAPRYHRVQNYHRDRSFNSYLTPEITEVVLANQHRVEDIIRYVEISGGSIDGGRLNEYLRTNVVTLAEGIL